MVALGLGTWGAGGRGEERIRGLNQNEESRESGWVYLLNGFYISGLG